MSWQCYIYETSFFGLLIISFLIISLYLLIIVFSYNFELVGKEDIFTYTAISIGVSLFTLWLGVQFTCKNKCETEIQQEACKKDKEFDNLFKK